MSAALNQVLSPRVYGLILSSPRLRNKIFPQGLQVSPYEVLSYDATLVLHDKRGARASFERTQIVRMLQDGVSAVLDHFWGEGILLTHYRNRAGVLGDSFKDAGKRHLVIDLKRSMGIGEILKFEVERTAMEAYTAKDGVMETISDHPIRRLTRRIVFPKSRPVQGASLHYGGKDLPRPMRKLADGRTAVGFELTKPRANTSYAIRWSW